MRFSAGDFRLERSMFVEKNHHGTVQDLLRKKNTNVQVYALTANSTDEEIKEFYSDL